MQGASLLEPICVGLSLLVPVELVCSRRLEPSTLCRGMPGLGAIGCAGSGTAVPGLAAAFKAN